jgi:hypothetical protein
MNLNKILILTAVVIIAVIAAYTNDASVMILAAGAVVAAPSRDNLLTVPPISMYQNSVVLDMDDTKYMIRHYVCSDQVNDYRQLLFPNKYVDEMYRKNPKVLYNHGGSGWFGGSSVKDLLEYTIAKNEKLSVAKENGVTYLLAETQFDSGSETAMSIYRLYKNGFMSAWSKYFKPIGKAKWDDENNMVVYDTWTMREYSAVDLPVDGFAVGTETYENALSLITSPLVKESIHRNALTTTINNQFLNSNLMHDIQELRDLVNSKKPDTDYRAEMNKLFKSFADELIPKLSEMAKTQNSLIDLMQKNKTDIAAIAEEACFNTFKKLMGKVNN